jgi:hypothetical protein
MSQLKILKLLHETGIAPSKRDRNTPSQNIYFNPITIILLVFVILANLHLLPLKHKIVKL